MQQTMKIWGSLALKKEEGRRREGLIRWSQEPPLFSLWTATCGGAFTDLLIAPALGRPLFCQPRNSLATINSWWSLLIISQFYDLFENRTVERLFDGSPAFWEKVLLSFRSRFPPLLKMHHFFIFLDFIVVNTSNNINTRLLLILLRFQMTGAATPCYWSDSQPTLNPDILISQYYAKPTMPRLMPTSHVIRKQWVFVIDQIISDLAHSSSPRINYFHPQQGSILTHWCGNECQPPTVL